MMKKLYKIQKNGKVFNILERPAFIIDTHHKSIIASSELEEIEDMFKSVYKTYVSANKASDVIMLELPLDQDIINIAYSDINYAIELYSRANGVADGLPKHTLNNIIRELNEKLKKIEAEKQVLCDKLNDAHHDNRILQDKLDIVYTKVKDFASH